jgi:amino-acid N-acetyltransferase
MVGGSSDVETQERGSAADARASGFSEREFYLREFRGRTLAVALPRFESVALGALRPPLDELARGGCRVLVLAGEGPVLARVCDGAVLAADHPRLEGTAWRALRERPRVGLRMASDEGFAAACRAIVLRLGIFKLVWLEAGGGLRTADGRRQSFVHLDELRAWLSESGQGLVTADRLPLWREVAAMLEMGLPALNVCTAEGLDEELFTYAGSGTLFTRERYVTVRSLGLDDYDAAHDLIQRGVAEGYLAERGPDELDVLLAHAFGAFVEGRYLAGIGALLPGDNGCSGELAGLYTLTRFLGEGVGYSLVAQALARARSRGYAYAFACTTSERVVAFFERNGFRLVGHGEVPAAKWARYDPARRARVRCLRRDLEAPAAGGGPGEGG